MPGFFENHREKIFLTGFLIGIYCGAMNKTKNLRYSSSLLILETMRGINYLYNGEYTLSSGFLLGYFLGWMGALARNLIVDEKVEAEPSYKCPENLSPDDLDKCLRLM